MTAPRTRPAAVLASFVGVFFAYGAAAVDQARPPKAPAPHPLLLSSNALAKMRVPTLPPPAPNGPAQPFVLDASAHDRALAEVCLAQAVYFEAGRQPMEGREAVAQTVINRLRHPDYPKSICGVVYEGSSLPTGCQFSFTCDGSLRRPLDPQLWSEAETVAKRALNGFVMTKVGEATYYHADYVRPFWASALKRITQIGAHIFYRWPGPSGDASAFTGRYAGHEADLVSIRRATDPRLATLRPDLVRHGVPYRAQLQQAVEQRTPVAAPRRFEAAERKTIRPALHLIEASYVTHGHARVQSVIRPAVDRQSASDATAPAHPVAYASLTPAGSAHTLAVTTAKVTLPQVRLATVATAAPVLAVPTAAAMPAK